MLSSTIESHFNIQHVKELLRYQKTEKRLIFRANIVLLNGYYQLSNKIICCRIGAPAKTVKNWISRAEKYGIIGLRDEPRSGRPLVFNPEIHAKVIHLATHPPYDDELQGFSTISSPLISWVMQHRHWVDSISPETIRKILRRHRLQVHRVTYWKTSHDPNFLEKMSTIVNYYLHPPPGKLIICVDEMPSIQALERIEHPLTSIGQIRRIEFEYKRHGTMNLFAAFNVQNGAVFGEMSQQKKHSDFLKFMKNVDRYFKYPAMMVIVDNYKTHNHQLVKEWIENQQGRIEFVFTPYHGSWLNQVEIWFGILKRCCLRHTSFKDTEELSTRIIQFMATWNNNFAKPFNWKFSGW